MSQYHFAIASKRFLLSEEPIEEVLRERIDYYLKNKQEIDFWLIDDLDLLLDPKANALEHKSNVPLLAIVSSNLNFINWLKLRIVYVKIGKVANPKLTDSELKNASLCKYIVEDDNI